MKFEHYEALLTIVALRMISHFWMGISWGGDAVTRALFFLVSGFYFLSFVGIRKRTKWGLELVFILSILFGTFTLFQISSAVDLVQLLFWNILPLYFAHQLYEKQKY